MHILHTESSNGWGGQEIRILKEALGLTARGFNISLAVTRGGRLVEYGRKAGLNVFEIDFHKHKAIKALQQLLSIIKKNKVDVVNTHSSLDAWIGGIAARLAKKPIVRTRHLSTDIRGGLNAYLLYNCLADFVVTTSSGIIPIIQKKARLAPECLACVPTGVEAFHVSDEARQNFRRKMDLQPEQLLVGTVCVVRSWKGIQDMISAAKILRNDPRFKWVVVGGGYIDHFRPLVDSDLPFIFTGHLDNPTTALAAFDIFLLLSTAHEGISQASLQAAYLEKPLITTNIGGLPEVCLPGITGIVVPPSHPEQVAQALLTLANDASLRQKMGENGKALVDQDFTFGNTLDKMASIFNHVYRHTS